ncbi:hypothetical protein B0H17DRAFT_1142904 [Mycena rosella]|uniref:Uncharacterized protein n=1 Tax=Mycena rosella TaxID=1033263 RepID=A0AAD7CW67_MYCRO|nr:hypothetical protein B0H17DRAFT_1142904 [Mycena rosella]
MVKMFPMTYRRHITIPTVAVASVWMSDGGTINESFFLMSSSIMEPRQYPADTPWSVPIHDVQHHVRSYASLHGLNTNGAPRSPSSQTANHFLRHSRRTPREMPHHVQITAQSTSDFWVEAFDVVVVSTGKYSTPTFPAYIHVIEYWSKADRANRGRIRFLARRIAAGSARLSTDSSSAFGTLTESNAHTIAPTFGESKEIHAALLKMTGVKPKGIWALNTLENPAMVLILVRLADLEVDLR